MAMLSSTSSVVSSPWRATVQRYNSQTQLISNTLQQHVQLCSSTTHQVLISTQDIDTSRSFFKNNFVQEEAPSRCTTDSINMVMSVYYEEGRLDEALNLWESASVVPNLSTYGILIDIFRSKGDAVIALRVYRRARQQFLGLNSTGILHERSKFNIETDSQEAPLGDIITEEVEGATVESIEKLGEVVLQVCLEKLSDGLRGEENRFILERLFMKMQYARLRPDKFTCRRLLLLCGEKSNDHFVLKSLYKYMFEHRMLTTTVCNHAISTYGYHHKWWAALEVFETMEGAGCKPNGLTYKLLRAQFSYLLKSCKKKKEWKWCLELMEKMEQKGVKPGRDAWDMALVTCSKSGRTDETIHLFERMIRWNYKPDLRAYSSLLSALEKQGLVQDMERVFTSMKNSKSRMPEHVYTTMITGYGKHGNFEQITRLVSEMESSKISVSVITFNAILTACARCGDAQAAVQWMRRIEACHLRPNSITLNKLVEALANGNRCTEAVSTYMYMLDMRMDPSPWAYDAVVKACRLNNVEIDYRWVGRRPTQRIPNLKYNANESSPINIKSD